MRMTFSNLINVSAAGLLALAVVAATGDGWSEVARWAVSEQRLLQDDMALAVQEVRSGSTGAWLALIAAAGAYGLAHAVGPGHGKFLIGGVGLGSQVSALRLAAIALISSLAQSLWAILLVYGGFALVEASAAQLIGLSEGYLAAASSLAIAGVGALLAFRGAKALWKRNGHSHSRCAHAHDAGGCGGHWPSPQQVAGMTSLRDAAVLVVSIAVRPCTGALFLLVIAWQMDIAAAGAAAVIAMGLGTAVTTSAVAVSSVAARALAYSSSGAFGLLNIAAPSFQLLSGLVIIWLAYALIWSGSLKGWML